MSTQRIKFSKIELSPERGRARKLVVVDDQGQEMSVVLSPAGRGIAPADEWLRLAATITPAAATPKPDAPAEPREPHAPMGPPEAERAAADEYPPAGFAVGKFVAFEYNGKVRAGQLEAFNDHTFHIRHDEPTAELIGRAVSTYRYDKAAGLVLIKAAKIPPAVPPALKVVPAEPAEPVAAPAPAKPTRKPRAKQAEPAAPQDAAESEPVDLAALCYGAAVAGW